MRFSSHLLTITFAAVSAAGALALAAPAQADATPTYTCDQVLPGAVVLGHGNCVASNGAATEGEFQGESLVVARQAPVRFHCRAGGRAQLPDGVVAAGCRPA
ncbi:hypothetical protein ABZ470_21625 [Streptosporangium sp. NPDC020072]|uniref:hypothetical protein n=1 Tax=Streptosporangium sp. NPDC020072 TaxID=3154788 RepID=UPI0034180AC6